MQIIQSRRDFLASLSAASAASLLGAQASLADEGPPETSTIKLAYYSNNCLAPLLVAEDLLRAEGFSDIRYVPVPESFTIPQLIARGDTRLVARRARQLPAPSARNVSARSQHHPPTVSDALERMLRVGSQHANAVGSGLL
jgi:hypothetical protein